MTLEAEVSLVISQPVTTRLTQAALILVVVIKDGDEAVSVMRSLCNNVGGLARVVAGPISAPQA